MSVYTNLLLCTFLVLATIDFGFSNDGTASNAGCIESERRALLSFKQDLVDNSDRLASWVDDDDGANCCQWAGVVCNISTQHITELQLQFSEYGIDSVVEYEAYKRSQFGGTINPSLLNLHHLIHLNLSGNDFGGSQIPNFLGSMGSLRQLDLSYAGFSGKVPPELGNLANIHYLSLGGNDQLYSENLQWLSCLSLLQHLDLSYANLADALNWLQVVNTLPSLVELRLSNGELRHIPPLTYVHNLSLLAVLDLSWNNFNNSLIPEWIFSLSNLSSIDLSGNSFHGPIPAGLQNMSSLQELHLSDNSFNSSIPDWLYSFGSRLKSIALGYNDLQGSISSAIGNLTSLVALELSVNAFEVVQHETINSIGHLCNLRSLDFEGIKLNQTVSNIFRALSLCVSNGLETLNLQSTGIFGELTNVDLGHFRRLASLDLTFNSISAAIPTSFGELQSLKKAVFYSNSMTGVVSEVHFAKLLKLEHFRAGGNSMQLKVNASWIPPFQISVLGLRSWQLGTQFPLWLHSQRSLTFLNLSNSSLACIVPHWFWNLSSALFQLDLSNNQITGKIPSIGANKVGGKQVSTVIDLSSNKFNGQVPKFNSKVLALDLSNNQFSGSIFHFLCDNESFEMELLNLGENFLVGEMTNCWTLWKSLEILRLDNNNFFGSIPSSIGELSGLKSLHLRNNSLSGGIPLSLESCKSLINIDLSENQLEGAIPTWIGHMPNLMILSLRSNKLRNRIPEEICELATLQILDLSHNNLSGSIPQCITNLNAMVNHNDSTGNGISYYFSKEFKERALLMMKGKMMEYNTTLKLVRSLDFSCNNLSSEIPKELAALVGLQSLNLSRNLLTGKIPQEIGAMKLIESLDLSMNQLFGEIPQSISNLNFLNHLNLSSNNLKGRIPSSTQLQSLDASCFIGNELCGLPLSVSCGESSKEKKDPLGVSYTESSMEKNDHGGHEEIKWLYVSIAFGFGVGFWGVVGPLLYNRQFRLAYFQFLDRLGDKIWFYWMF